MSDENKKPRFEKPETRRKKGPGLRLSRKGPFPSPEARALAEGPLKYMRDTGLDQDFKEDEPKPKP
ncbi:MAG: hypothetical protein AAF549_05555 [Pseudomonadota bacterium]